MALGITLPNSNLLWTMNHIGSDITSVITECETVGLFWQYVPNKIFMVKNQLASLLIKSRTFGGTLQKLPTSPQIVLSVPWILQHWPNDEIIRQRLTCETASKAVLCGSSLGYENRFNTNSPMHVIAFFKLVMLIT